MRSSASSKEDVIDLINIAIEELIRQRFELPAFSTFERTAKRIRAEMDSTLQQQATANLTIAEQSALDRLFLVDPDSGESPWNQLKADPENPTLSHFDALMQRVRWLTAIPISTATLTEIPAIKIQRFATEALALDANRMKDMQARKRYTLALSLLQVQRAQTCDDVAEMFVKRMAKVQQQAHDGFDAFQQETRERVTRLITALRDVTKAYSKEGTADQRLTALTAAYGGQSATILEECELHLVLRDNYSNERIDSSKIEL